jgi:hypothetical protein
MDFPIKLGDGFFRVPPDAFEEGGGGYFLYGYGGHG